MSTRIFQIDAFADRPFSGNPAGVCLLESEPTAQWMQNLAAEMNLSETAFLRRQPDGWSLRWFTPATEVKLCGHATLASAHALWESGELKPDEAARFHTLSGLLTARRAGDWIEMDFPVVPVKPVEKVPPGLAEALGVKPVAVGDAGWTWLVEVGDATVIRHMAPDFAALLRVPHGSAIVTSRADRREYDFLSRFFAPSVGVNEDPVTGSAHCSLAPYWAGKLGRNELIGYQASQRGGVVKVALAGDRVKLRGQAVTVFSGMMSSPG